MRRGENVRGRRQDRVADAAAQIDRGVVQVVEVMVGSAAVMQMVMVLIVAAKRRGGLVAAVMVVVGAAAASVIAGVRAIGTIAVAQTMVVVEAAVMQCRLTVSAVAVEMEVVDGRG